MIYLDDRAGSKELLGPLTRLGLEVDLTRLEYGDIAFSGNGAEGSIAVGIEYKTVQDFLNSIETGRFAGHQLPGMKETYEVCYLVVEGIVKEGSGGPLDSALYIRRGKDFWPARSVGAPWTYEGYFAFLNTLYVRAQVMHYLPASDGATCRLVRALYRYWQKDWDAHNALKAVHFETPTRLSPGLSKLERDKIRFVAGIPGVGWELARRALEHFGWDPGRLLRADEKEWRKVKGIGKEKARTIGGWLK